jgi:hypothetical protein
VIPQFLPLDPYCSSAMFPLTMMRTEGSVQQ